VSTGRSCTRCGAVLATDQAYCLDCGARQGPAGETPWRAPLVGAAAALAVGILALLAAYLIIRSDADGAAKSPAPAVTSAPTQAPGAPGVPPLLPAGPSSP